MPKVHLLHPDGRETVLDARAGQSLMTQAVDAGIAEIVADCGGCLTCATCHVVVDDAWLGRLPPPSTDEQAMLEMTAEPRLAGSRLSCQITLIDGLDGLRVALPARQY